jgi:hypothetical protein
MLRLTVLVLNVDEAASVHDTLHGLGPGHGVLTSDPVKGYAKRGLQFVLEEYLGRSTANLQANPDGVSSVELLVKVTKTNNSN